MSNVQRDALLAATTSAAAAVQSRLTAAGDIRGAKAVASVIARAETSGRLLRENNELRAQVAALSTARTAAQADGFDEFADQVHSDSNIRADDRPVGWANRMRAHAADLRATK